MLSFFPKPYPDEILYSVLARYHLRSGNTGPKLTAQEVFDSRDVIATVDLPCNLEALIAKLKFISQMTVEELIQKHTLYPFYAPFLPPERAQQIVAAMRSEKGGSIHNQIGIRASSIRVPKHFRFCPTCISDDQAKYGELYWHRVHQVPGILVCPHHAEVLQESSVSIQGTNRHEYVAASVDNCQISQTQKRFSNHAFNIFKLLAEDAYFLLEHELPCRELNWFRKQYISLLIEQELATATGRVHQRSLVKQFLSAYNEEILQALDSTLHAQDDHNWLFSLVRKHRKAFHPIRHLLIIRFLGFSVAELLGNDRGYQPFGAGPWLCLNPAAEHYQQSVITNLQVSRCCDTKKPVGTFACSCGFVYCRTGPDQMPEDAYRIGKIRAVGSAWQQKLKHLVEAEQLGLRETARQLKVDPNTIKRYVRLLGLDPHWRSYRQTQDLDLRELPCSIPSDSDDLKTQHRNTWITLRMQHPQASKTALRRLAPATYMWLYRHDQDWLNQNSPSIQKPICPNNRVNWQERDKQILAQVQDAVQKLLSADKPIRITVSRVAKAIGQLALIEQHLVQLPQTKAYLESVIESIEDYQIRRVRWAVNLLALLGETIEFWRVIRLAGLRPNYSTKVQNALEREIYRR